MHIAHLLCAEHWAENQIADCIQAMIVTGDSSTFWKPKFVNGLVKGSPTYPPNGHIFNVENF